VSVAVALACASGASADQVRLTRADQATAKRDVLRLADLPMTATWKASNSSSGGSATPAGCKSLAYGGSQIVDTGHAQSQFTGPGVFVMNIVGVVSETKMMHAVWQHVFAQSNLAPCLRAELNEDGKGKLKVLSTTRLLLPRLATSETGYRMVFQMTVKGVSVRGAFDLVVMGGGRTISMLFVMGILGPSNEQASGEAAMNVIDGSLVGKLAGRAFAPPSSSTALAA
jgi:hypothetical protein